LGVVQIVTSLRQIGSSLSSSSLKGSHLCPVAVRTSRRIFAIAIAIAIATTISSPTATSSSAPVQVQRRLDSACGLVYLDEELWLGKHSEQIATLEVPMTVEGQAEEQVEVGLSLLHYIGAFTRPQLDGSIAR
jgi:hypothetical protein